MAGHMQFESEITTLYYKAFANKDNLEVVSLPDTVKKIESNCFYNCKNLKAINLENVYLIKKYAFFNCASLTSITLSQYLTLIEEYTFYNCSNLTSISFSSENNINKICTKSFMNCTSLTSVELSNNITCIEDYAFYNCSNLTSVTFRGTTYKNSATLCNTLRNIGVSVGTHSFQKTGLTSTSSISELYYTSTDSSSIDINKNTTSWNYKINSNIYTNINYEITNKWWETNFYPNNIINDISTNTALWSYIKFNDNYCYIYCYGSGVDENMYKITYEFNNDNIIINTPNAIFKNITLAGDLLSFTIDRYNYNNEIVLKNLVFRTYTTIGYGVDLDNMIDNNNFIDLDSNETSIIYGTTDGNVIPLTITDSSEWGANIISNS